jgi:hypothetical protein
MKKYLAILILLFCGCATPTPDRIPNYHEGQLVNLRINGRRGQILEIQAGPKGVTYTIRVDSKNGARRLWKVDEFELTLEKP